MSRFGLWLAALVAGFGIAVVLTWTTGNSTATAVSAQAGVPNIYYSSDSGNSLGSANLDGSGVNQSFVTSATAPQSVAADGNYVYWINGGSTGSIGRADRDGSNVNANFVTGISNAAGIAVDSHYIYYTANGAIGRANLDGSGNDPTFITGLNGPYGITVDAQHIYWTDLGGSIGEANLDASGVKDDFITGLTYPVGIAVSSSNIYWTTGDFGKIGEANLDGTGINLSFITGTGGGTELDLASGELYWINYDNGDIDEASAGGGQPSTLIPGATTGAKDPEGLAVTEAASSTLTPTGLQVVCNDVSPGQAGDYDQCTAQVGGASNPSELAPTGTVTFTVNPGGSGGFPTGSTCTLQSDPGGGNSSFCSVEYSPPAPPETAPPITATYSGDTYFASSSGSPGLLGVPTTPTDTATTATTTTDTTATTTTTDTTPTCQATPDGGDLRSAAQAPRDTASATCSATSVSCSVGSATIDCQVYVVPLDGSDPPGSTFEVVVNGSLQLRDPAAPPKLGGIPPAPVDTEGICTLAPTGRKSTCVVQLEWPDSILQAAAAGKLKGMKFAFKAAATFPAFAGPIGVQCQGSDGVPPCFALSDSSYSSLTIPASAVPTPFAAQVPGGETAAQAEGQSAAAGDAAANGSGETTAALARAARRLALGKPVSAAGVSAASGASLVAASESLLWQVLALDAGRPSATDRDYATVLAPDTPPVPSSLFVKSAVGQAEHSVVATILDAESTGGTLAQTLDRLATAQAKHKSSAARAQRKAASLDLGRLSKLLGSLPAAETKLAGWLTKAGLGTVTVTASELHGWHGVPAALTKALAEIGAGSFTKQLDADVKALTPGVYPFAASFDSPGLLTATKAASAALKHDAGLILKQGASL